MSVSAFIDEIPLLASSPVKWSLRAGVKPVIESFDVSPQDAMTLFGKIGKPVTLKIDPSAEGGKPVEVKNLYVLNIIPGDNPFISRVALADRRWFWTYAHVGPSGYNIRRNVGTKRILSVGNVLENQSLAPDVWFARWSLNPPQTTISGNPWKANELLRKVISTVLGHETKYNGESAGLGAIPDVSKLPVDNLMLDDSGDNAILRLLAYMPELALYIDYSGNVIVYSRTSGGEKDVADALGPEIVGRGHVAMVSNAALRPREIHVFFTREVELRFDAIEEGINATTSPDIGATRQMKNVLPIPDFKLTVGGDELPQGTWKPVWDVMAAWTPTLPEGIDKIDHELVQRAFMPFMDLWAGFGLTGQFVQLADWPSRIAALQRHYRRTYQINSVWMDNIKKLMAYTVRTVDPISRQRGPALAYSDYCVIPSQKFLYCQALTGGSVDLTYAINVDGYPAGGDFAAIGGDSRPAPADVVIADHDQGIIHIEYKIDPFRNREEILPSKITGPGGKPPTADVRKAYQQRNRVIAFNELIGKNNVPRLSPDHKLAVILTAVPASPNNKNQLHKIVVKPQDVEDKIPSSQRLGLSNAQGPIMEIRIGPGVEVARVVWSDDPAHKKAIEAIFGIPPDVTPGAYDSILKDLTINEGTSHDFAAGGASLNALAVAAAARVYASLVDRMEGQKTGMMNGQIEPSGWTEEVTHEVSTKGEATTMAVFPDKVPQISLVSWLDESTRRVIMGLPSSRM